MSLEVYKRGWQVSWECQSRNRTLVILASHYLRSQQNGLVERLWLKTQNWKHQLLSGAGKEVLIKVVLQAIPVYVMSCFKLPLSLCSRLQRIIIKFWWSHNMRKQPIHWDPRHLLFLDKKDGGLGFRDLVALNEALLARQVWRIMSCPDTLMSMILKAKYFRNSDLLTAPVGSQPSTVWTSIHSCCAIVRRWIDASNPSSPSWIPSVDGTFSSKSAYRAIRDLKVREEANIVGESSHTADNNRFWTYIWRAGVENKIKTFIWRIVYDALPVGLNLARRGCTGSLNCRVCGGSPESSAHLFIHCWWSKALWMQLEITETMVSENFDSVDEWLWHCMNLLPKENFVKICYGLYWIWYNRNLIAHMDKGLEVVSCSLNIAQSIKRLQNPTANPKVLMEDSDIAWTAPTPGTIKVNCDGAFDGRLRIWGTSCVARDHGGAILGVSSSQILNASSSMDMECLAIFKAISWAKHNGWQKVIFETDSVTAFKEILCCSGRCMYGRYWLFESAKLIHAQRDWSLNLIRREAKSLADDIAVSAKEGSALASSEIQ